VGHQSIQRHPMALGLALQLGEQLRVHGQLKHRGRIARSAIVEKSRRRERRPARVKATRVVNERRLDTGTNCAPELVFDTGPREFAD